MRTYLNIEDSPIEVGDAITVRYENDLRKEFGTSEEPGLEFDIYPFGFNLEMLELCGEKVTVTHVSRDAMDTTYKFLIEEDEGDNSWSYNMFKESKDEERRNRSRNSDIGM
jgi:hypothetical protein